MLQLPWKMSCVTAQAELPWKTRKSLDVSLVQLLLQTSPESVETANFNGNVHYIGNVATVVEIENDAQQHKQNFSTLEN